MRDADTSAAKMIAVRASAVCVIRGCDVCSVCICEGGSGDGGPSICAAVPFTAEPPARRSISFISRSLLSSLSLSLAQVPPGTCLNPTNNPTVTAKYHTNWAWLLGIPYPPCTSLMRSGRASLNHRLRAQLSASQASWPAKVRAISASR